MAGDLLVTEKGEDAEAGITMIPQQILFQCEGQEKTIFT